MPGCLGDTAQNKTRYVSLRVSEGCHPCSRLLSAITRKPGLNLHDSAIAFTKKIILIHFACSESLSCCRPPGAIFRLFSCEFRATHRRSSSLGSLKMLTIRFTDYYLILYFTRRGTRRCPRDRRVDDISGRPYVQSVHTPASGRIANVQYEY